MVINIIQREGFYLNPTFNIYSDKDKQDICNAISIANDLNESCMSKFQNPNGYQIMWWNYFYSLINKVDILPTFRKLYKKVKSWNCIILAKDGVVTLFIKEKRLHQLQLNAGRMPRLRCYMLSLLKMINKDNQPVIQESLFQEESEGYEEILPEEEKEAKKLIEELLDEGIEVKNIHFIVIDNSPTALSASAAIVNTDFKIIESINFYDRTYVTMTAIVDSTNAENLPSDDCNMGITLKEKALKRMAENQNNVKYKTEEKANIKINESGE